MPTISPILPNDGEAIDASDVNNPFNTIIGLLNGNLDEQNIKPGSLSWNVMSNFQNQIPSAALQDNANLGKFKKDANISFIPEGLIWSHVTGLNASMTAGRYYSNSGDIVSITAISSRTFNSSKDTYIYVGQNGTINYSSVGNNAAQPSLPANSNWLAKVVTNDSTITSIIDMRQTRLVGAHNIDFTDMPLAEKIQVKRDNDTQPVKPVIMQCGRSMIRITADTLEAPVNIQFSKPFKSGTIPMVVCTYNGYGNANDPWTDTPNSSWAGAAFGAVGVTNSGFIARCRRFDGAALRGTYYFSWIAIGQV